MFEQEYVEWDNVGRVTQGVTFSEQWVRYTKEKPIAYAFGSSTYLIPAGQGGPSCRELQ